jgi:hypothetical protein
VVICLTDGYWGAPALAYEEGKLPRASIPKQGEIAVVFFKLMLDAILKLARPQWR